MHLNWLGVTTRHVTAETDAFNAHVSATVVIWQRDLSKAGSMQRLQILDPGWVQKTYDRTDPDLNKFSNFDKVTFDPPFMAFHF